MIMPVFDAHVPYSLYQKKPRGLFTAFTLRTCLYSGPDIKSGKYGTCFDLSKQHNCSIKHKGKESKKRLSRKIKKITTKFCKEFQCIWKIFMLHRNIMNHTSRSKGPEERTGLRFWLNLKWKSIFIFKNDKGQAAVTDAT